VSGGLRDEPALCTLLGAQPALGMRNSVWCDLVLYCCFGDKGSTLQACMPAWVVCIRLCYRHNTAFRHSNTSVESSIADSLQVAGEGGGLLMP
jgi:hypothetical protein